MSQDWMIDVLRDLRKFSQKNGLAGLAEQLDDTIHIAVEEITAKARKTAVVEPYARPNGSVPGARRAL